MPIAQRSRGPLTLATLLPAYAQFRRGRSHRLDEMSGLSGLLGSQVNGLAGNSQMRGGSDPTTAGSFG